jgi:hypothetical protein
METPENNTMSAVARQDTEVSILRREVKDIIILSQNTHDINSLLEQLERLCQINIYVQEEESQMSGLLADAKQMINTARESVKVFEAETALRLNSRAGGNVPMGRAEKMAFLASEPLRDEMRACEEAWIDVSKDHNNIRGVKNAIAEYIMTIRQKIKQLQIEIGIYPHREGNA